MILTVTVNPMMEHVFRVPGFRAGDDFRPEGPPGIFATGKPLNVARALRDLGEEVVSVVAVGGATGREIVERLEAEGLDHHVVALRRESRRGFTVYDEHGHTTTVYGPAPRMEDSEVEAVVAAVRSMLPARLVVVGGSTSRPDLYPRLCESGSPVVLDARGEALLGSLRVGNVLIAKPNLRECRQTLGISDPHAAATELRRLGARWAVVTDRGGDAVFQLGRATLRATPPSVDVVHTVGCGDALLAGLIRGMMRPAREAVALAMACGSQAATRADIGRVDPEQVEALVDRVEIR